MKVVVGDVLDFLDELGIADNTFVMYSTDNGPHMNAWSKRAPSRFFPPRGNCRGTKTGAHELLQLRGFIWKHHEEHRPLCQ